MKSSDISNVISIAFDQIRGARDYQEDSGDWFIQAGSTSQMRAILVLADGMGGEVGGATASDCAVKASMNSLRAAEKPEILLEQTLNIANESIAAAIQLDPALDRMGTTLVLAVVAPDGLRWLSVGDSPLWLIRNGQIWRLNEDHSMAPILERLVEIGRMTPEEAARSPRRNELRSVIEGREIEMIDHPTNALPLIWGDWVVLASDGVQTLPDEKIASLVNASQSAEGAAAAILEEIKLISAPYQDNASVAIVKCDGTAFFLDAKGAAERDRAGLRGFGHLRGTGGGRHPGRSKTTAAIMLTIGLIALAILWILNVVE